MLIHFMPSLKFHFTIIDFTFFTNDIFIKFHHFYAITSLTDENLKFFKSDSNFLVAEFNPQ